MNHANEHRLSVTLALCLLLLQACAPAMTNGAIYELGAGATARGLEMVARGEVGTHLITDGKLVLALWPVGEYWGAACINCAAADPMAQWRQLTGGRGMVMNFKTANELVQYLKRGHGWWSVPISGAAQTAGYTLRSMAGAITGFLVVPAGVMDALNVVGGEPGVY